MIIRIFLILFFLSSILSQDAAFGQYLVKKKINTSELARNIRKEQGVKKITSFNKGKKSWESYYDREGYEFEEREYNEYYNYTNDDINLDSIRKTIKDFTRRIAYFRDSEGRDTMVIIYNHLDFPYKIEIHRYYPDFYEEELLYHGDILYEGIYLQRDSAGRIVNRKSSVAYLNKSRISNLIDKYPENYFLIDTSDIRTKYKEEIWKYKITDSTIEAYRYKLDSLGNENYFDYSIYDKKKNTETRYLLNEKGDIKEINRVCKLNENGQLLKLIHYTDSNQELYTSEYKYLPNGFESEEKTTDKMFETTNIYFSTYEYDETGKTIKHQYFINDDLESDVIYEYEYYED